MKNDTKTEKKSMKRVLNGKVVSVAMNHTIVVEVVHLHRHPLYKKMIKRTKNFAVDADPSTVAVGDNVTIEETRPISKTKHFRLIGKAEK